MNDIFDPFFDKKKKDISDTPVVRLGSGETIRGKFVDVIEKSGTQMAVIEPHSGRPEIAIESPGLSDLFNRTKDEVNEVYTAEYEKYLSVNEAGMRVEARAVNVGGGRVYWDVEPLQDKKFSEPVRASEIVKIYREEILPELEEKTSAAKQTRLALGLRQKTLSDNSKEWGYPRAKSSSETIELARSIVLGSEYIEARNQFEKIEKEERKLREEQVAIKKVQSLRKELGKEVEKDLEKRLRNLEEKSAALQTVYLSTKASYVKHSQSLKKEEVMEAVKEEFKKLFHREQVKQVAREQADKDYTQSLVKQRNAEQNMHEFKALGKEVVEIERSARGVPLPSNRHEFRAQLNKALKKGKRESNQSFKPKVRVMNRTQEVKKTYEQGSQIILRGEVTQIEATKKKKHWSVITLRRVEEFEKKEARVMGIVQSNVSISSFVEAREVSRSGTQSVFSIQTIERKTVVEMEANEIANLYRSKVVPNLEQERDFFLKALLAGGAKFFNSSQEERKVRMPREYTQEELIVRAKRGKFGDIHLGAERQMKGLERQLLIRQRIVKDLERRTTQLRTTDFMSGKAFYLKKNLRNEQKTLFRLTTQYVSAAKRLNNITSGIRKEAQEMEIKKRTKALAVEQRVRTEKINKLKTAFELSSHQLTDAKSAMKEFKSLGTQKVLVFPNKGRVVPADRMHFERQLKQAQELARTNDLTRQRGI